MAPEIPRGGIDVSLPDGDDESGLCAQHQDTWEIKNGQVIRHHKHPRIKLFQPHATEECPANPEWLLSTRMSISQQIKVNHGHIRMNGEAP